MYGLPLTLLIASLFGTGVVFASYFGYFKKTDTPRPIRKAIIMGGITFIVTLLMGLALE